MSTEKHETGEGGFRYSAWLAAADACETLAQSKTDIVMDSMQPIWTRRGAQAARIALWDAARVLKDEAANEKADA